MKSGKILFDNSSDEYNELMQYDMSFYPEWDEDNDLLCDNEAGSSEPSNDKAMSEPVGQVCAELKHVSIMRPADCRREGMFSSGKIHLRVKTGRCREGQYSAMVYMSTGILVASEIRVIGRKQVERNELRFSPYSHAIWCEDDYFVVFLYEDEPFALSKFRYEGKDLHALPVHSLGSDDWEYQLVKYWDDPLNKSEENKPVSLLDWFQIQKLTGLGSVRRKLVGLTDISAFNQRCGQYGVKRMRLHTSAVIETPNLEKGEQLARSLSGILNLDAAEMLMIDCEHPTAECSDLTNCLQDDFQNYAAFIYHLPALLKPSSALFLHRLEQAVISHKLYWVPVLCGSADEIRQLMAASPVLAKAFRKEDYYVMHEETMAEWLCTFQRVLSETSFTLSVAAEHRLVLQVRDNWNIVRKWDRHDIRCFIREYLSERFRHRLQTRVLSNPKDATDMDVSQLTTLQPEDICLPDYRPDKQSRDISGSLQEYEASMRELHALVGLSSLKAELDDMLMVARFEAARQKLGVYGSFHMLHHMLFTGNPGTGKTTVARLIGKIFKSLGLLSKGEVIEVERRQLVGAYIGHTEERMTELLKKAKGNVLFVDEAYTLCDTKEDRKDFGNHVIESLLSVMTDPHSDILVIFAGYEDEMERLMEVNQGLKGRFGHHFHFDDYNADELVEIARLYLNERSCQLVPEAETKLKEAVSRFLMQKSRTFSNARWMLHFVTSGILPVMARRIMEGGVVDKVDLFRRVEETDVSGAVLKLNLFPAVTKPETSRKRIGFIA